MRKKILIGSIIAVALLTLVSFSSVVGYQSVKNTQEEIITDEWDFEYCKDYLFETLVEISNNEDVSDLINSNNQNLLPTNTNHRLLMPFRRNTNRMSLSVEKLDFLYSMGKKLFDRLGEEKVAEIKETISIDKPEFADELNTIVMGNDDLKERIYTLNEMNNEEINNPQPDFDLEFPIICGVLLVLEPFCWNLTLLEHNIVSFIHELFGGFYFMVEILSAIVQSILSPLTIPFDVLSLLWWIFDCPPIPVGKVSL